MLENENKSFSIVWNRKQEIVGALESEALHFRKNKDYEWKQADFSHGLI